MVTQSNYQKKKSWKFLPKYIIGFVLIAVIIWAMKGTDVGITKLISGIPNIFEYLARMTPPDTSILTRMEKPILETFQIAIVSLAFAAIIALPLSFIAARNVMPNPVIYQLVRTFMGILRGIPPLLYAILLVAMVGLGAFAGVLALTLHVVGSLGRFFSEAIENINPEVMDAAKAVGANKIKIITHAIIPELSALFLGYTLFYFEHNVRTSTVLGLVGAGGIGLQVMISIHLFRYKEVAALLLAIIGIIVVMDRLSFMIRMRLIKGKVVV